MSSRRLFDHVFWLILFAAFCFWFLATTAEAADRIPSRAYQYREVLRAEVRRQWGLNLPADAYAVSAGTIHQESAWNPRAQSPYAKGLTQFTGPTWGDIIKRDPSIAALGDVWNPHAAIRAMAVYHRTLWNQFPEAADENNRWAFVLSSYNGGAGWVRRDRTLAKSKGADPSRWWDNVEKYSTRAAWAFKENRGYPYNILKRWLPLYAGF